VEHAATGLAAAWAFTRFAVFRIATLYLADDPSSELIEKLTFREDSRGANLWLVAQTTRASFTVPSRTMASAACIRCRRTST
jgi:hypothetical protein